MPQFLKLNKTSFIIFLIIVILPIIILLTGIGITSLFGQMAVYALLYIWSVVDSILNFGVYTDAPRTSSSELAIILITYIVVMFYVAKIINYYLDKRVSKINH